MESLHNEILELTLAGYWDWNIRDNTQYFSPKFSSMFGYKENELPNSTLAWRQIIFPEDLSKAFESFQNHLKNNSHGDYITEARYKHKDGSEVWVICSGKVIEWDENGNPIRMIGSHTDITKQKQAEIALKISEERFKGAFENSAIGMALVSAEGFFIKVNKTFCLIVGYDEKEILNLTFQDITHPDDLEKDLDNVEKLLLNEINSFNIEKRYIHKDNSIIWINLSVSLVRDNNGIPIHFVSQIEDITDKKRISEEIKQKEELLSVVMSNIPGSIHQYHYLDRFKAKITFATDSIFEIFEVTPEEVKENSFKIFERTYEEDKKGLIESFEKS
ncbi:MAG: PAS domain S-box protein, partial [Candidatus Sericytochromatia bacterium]